MMMMVTVIFHFNSALLFWCIKLAQYDLNSPLFKTRITYRLLLLFA